MMENHNRMLAGAKSIGVRVENIGAEDIMKGVPHLCLGLIWQILKVGLLKGIKDTNAASGVKGSTKGKNKEELLLGRKKSQKK